MGMETILTRWIYPLITEKGKDDLFQDHLIDPTHNRRENHGVVVGKILWVTLFRIGQRVTNHQLEGITENVKELVNYFTKITICCRMESGPKPFLYNSSGEMRQWHGGRWNG